MRVSAGLRDLITERYRLAEPIRLALISDTHIFPSSQRTIAQQAIALFRRSGASVIVHAGDVTCAEVIEQLAEIAPVLAVRGNNDRSQFGKELPEVLELTIGERLLRVVHGDGGRSARVVASELSAGCDVVIYGHSHIPKIERVGEAILINPGSPSDRRWHPHFGVGFLTIVSGVITPALVPFEDPHELDRIELPPIPSGG